MKKTPSRSTFPRILSRSIAGFIASLAVLPAAKAQTTFTWTNAAGGSWNTGTNWAGGLIAGGADNIADFSTLNITANRTVTLDGNRTIGTLRFGDATTSSNTWTLNVGTPTTSTITLDVSSGFGTIDVINQTATIGAVLAGTDGLRKIGLGTARINGANTISGDLVVDGGTLQLGNNAGINNLSATINVNFNTAVNAGNGTVLQIMDNITIGAGRVVNLITGNTGTTQHRASLMGQNGAIWQGDVVYSGTSSAGINANAGTFTINGNISGTAGTFFARGAAGTGTINGNVNIGNIFFKTDAGTWIINSTGHTWINATQIADGQLQLGINNAFPTTLPIIIGQGSGTNGRLEMNGFNQAVPGLRTDGASSGTAHIIRNSNFNTASNLTVDIADGSTDTLRNTHIQGLGALTITKNGLGRWEFQDGRYDHSNIALNAGTLAFTGSNNVMVASTITGNAAAVIEKSGLSVTTMRGAYNHAGLTSVLDGALIFGGGTAGTITVGDNTTLGAGFGGATLNTSSLTFGTFGASTFATILGAPGGNPAVNATALTISGIGTSVAFEGANITPGVYPLISYGSPIGGLGFAGLSLGAPGTFPHVTASLVNNTGANRVDLNVTAVDSLLWTGVGGNAWDVNFNPNFKLASNNAAAPFFQGDRVRFDDTGLNRGIAASPGIRIGDLTFNHSAGIDYAVMGSLGGPGGITKTGTGTTGLNGIGVSSVFGDGALATVVTAHEHGFTSGQQVTINNSNVAYNGTFTVNVVDATTFTFASTTTAANTSGSVTAALANSGSTFTGGISVNDGVLILGGVNVAHGAVNVTGGTLRLANAAAISGGAPVTISNGGTLDVNGQAVNANLRIPSIHVSGEGVNGNGAIVNTGAGITNLNHALEITLDGDTTWGGTGRYDLNTTTRFNGGSFTLTKVGSNEMWYTPAAGSTVGNVIVNGGTFGVQSTNPLATTSTVTINAGAFHTIFSAVNLQHPAIINDGGTLRTNSSTPVFNGTVTLNGLGSNQFLGATGTNTLNIAGKITGPGGFTKSDTGTVQIRNSTNDYAGDTVVTAGTLNFSLNGVLPLGTDLVVDGGTFDPSNLTHTVASLSGVGGAINQAAANAGVIVSTQSTTTEFLGQLNRTLLRMNGTGSLTLGGAADNITGTAEVNSGTLILAKTGTLDVHGVGAGGVGLTINNGGTVKLGGPQSGGGTGSNVPPAGAPVNYVDQIFNLTDVVMATGSVFDLTGFSEAVDGLTGGGIIRTSVAGTANSRLYVGYGNTSGQFTGVIENGAGTVEFEKLGTGTFLLTGANTYTGSTTVTVGALANLGSLASASLTAAGGTTVFSPGTVAGSVTLNGNANYVGTGNIGGAVTLNVDSIFTGGGAIGGNVSLSGTSVFTSNGSIGGIVTLDGGIFNGGGNVTGAIIGNNGSTINIARSGVGTISAGLLTFPAAATRTWNIGLSGIAADRINVTSSNGLTLDGTTNIFVQPGAGGWVTGSYPILGYTGAVQGAGVSSLSLQTPGGHSTLSILDNGTGTISLQVTGVGVKWVGGNGNAWDTNATLNWSSPDQLFLAGDGVRLDDTATTFAPTIGTNVNPASVTFDTATSNYVLSGSAGIASGSLWKLGTGTVRITNPNTYTGPTGVQQGILSAVYSAGIVPIAAASVIDVSAGATFNANSANADFTLANTITGLGTIVIDPNNGGTAGDRQVTLSSNLAGFAGKLLLSPTAGGGTFRVAVDNGLDLGLGSVEIDDGGQVFVSAAGLVIPNDFRITGSGYVEPAGSLGAIRSSTTTFTGNIAVEGTAKIGALGATATFTGNVSGGDLTLGGSNNNSAETFILTGNATGLASLNVNDGFASGSANTITLIVGNGGTSGNLGTVPVTLTGDGFKTAAVRFDRSNGYTLGASINSFGSSNRTDLQIDTLGTGFNSNDQDINLGTGSFRVGVTREGASATINGLLSAGTITVGALNTATSTRNATLNFISDAVVSASSILVAAGSGTAPLGNTNNSTLNIGGTSTVGVSGNFFLGEQNSSNGFVNQTGGDVTVGGQFRVGHWPNNTSVYNLSGGTFTMSGFPGQFPFATGVAETGGGIYLGIDGTGVFNQSGGTVRTNFIVLDNRGNTGAGVNTPTGTDTYNLTGGELRITNDFGIISRNSTTAFNLAGGTIIADTSFNLDTNKLNVTALTNFDTNSNTITNFGRISGTSSIVISGGGTFTNVDSTSVEIGTNAAFEGGSFGSVNPVIAASTTLQSDRSGNDVWSGVLTGLGTLLKSNTGSLTLTGNSAATFTGATNVNGGSLLVNGSLAGSTMTVNAGGTLGGTGTAGLVNILGGSIAPGEIVGTLATGPLSLNGAAALKFELAQPGVVGGVNDLLSVTGALTLDGTLQVTQLAGFGFGTYRLINYTGLLTNNGLDLESTFLAQYPESLIDITTPGQVNLVVVPEPGAFLSLVGGFGLLCGLQRFRRRR